MAGMDSGKTHDPTVNVFPVDRTHDSSASKFPGHDDVGRGEGRISDKGGYDMYLLGVGLRKCKCKRSGESKCPVDGPWNWEREWIAKNMTADRLERRRGGETQQGGARAGLDDDTDTVTVSPD
jgi:hypothetical protein